MKKMMQCMMVMMMSLLWIQCAGHSEGIPFNVIVIEETPLLEYGPMQTVPATQTLKAGNRVRIVQSAGNFVMVETVAGARGFVPKDVLKFHNSGQEKEER